MRAGARHALVLGLTLSCCVCEGATARLGLAANASRPSPSATGATPPAAPVTSSSNQYEVTSFATTAAAGYAESEHYAADFVMGDLASGGASGVEYRSGYGFWGSVRDTAFTVGVAPPAAPPADFEGIRLLRQAGRLGIQFALDGPGPCALSVFDVSGRLIYRTEQAQPAGVSTLWWEGNDASGHSVSGGMYFVRVRWGVRTATARALWLH